MKFLNYKQNNEIRLAIMLNERIIDVVMAGTELKINVPTTMQELIEEGNAGKQLMQSLTAAKTADVDAAAITYAPAVTAPEKIICVGLNYLKHTTEFKKDSPDAPALPTVPILFSKFNNALAACCETVTLPKASAKCDYEAELVIVMGKTASNISEDEALDYVFGYTTGNDISARDLQKRTPQWLLGKTCDGFAPVGPFIADSQNIDPQNLHVTCYLNGEKRQDGYTKDMIFTCRRIISYISQHMTLKPGDIIFTGTPEGVILGMPEDKKQWLKAGDVMEVTIDGIGTLKTKLA